MSYSAPLMISYNQSNNRVKFSSTSYNLK